MIPSNHQSGSERALPLRSEQQLIQDYYAQSGMCAVQPIATTNFLSVSKESYPAPWLAREIAQNFVDHNALKRGTLDGVIIIESSVAEFSTFRVEGNWSFKDYTGLIAPHSAKEESREHQNAGGNGIGLKQVALRYLRDLDVSEFNIEGEGWAISYKLIKANDFNNFQEAGQQRLQHDWLIAEIRPSSNSERCIYEIKTRNQEVCKTIRELPEIAVGQNNSYLQNVDYANKFGTFKWHLPSEETRLFMNGQVFACDSKQKNDWPGPECLTLSLTNLKYRISIDRPALSDYQLLNYCSNLVDSMSKADLITQLHQSSKVWTSEASQKSYFETPFGIKFLEKIVNRLVDRFDFSAKDFQVEFPNGKFLTYSDNLTKAQLEQIADSKHLICPKFFEKLGVVSAKSIFVDPEAGRENRPDGYSAQRGLAKLALEAGIQVYADDLNLNLTSAGSFISTHLGKWIDRVEECNQQKMRIHFANFSPSGELLAHPLHHPTNPEQKAISFIRSLIFTGLKSKWLDDAFLAINGNKVTFDCNYDLVTQSYSLLSRITLSENDGKNYLELTCKSPHRLVLSKEDVNSAPNMAVFNGKEEKITSPSSRQYALWTSAAALITVIGWLGYSNKDRFAGVVSLENKKPIPNLNPEISRPRKQFPENPLAKYQTLLEQVESSSSSGKDQANSPSQKYLDWKKQSPINNLPKTAPEYLSDKTIFDVISQMNQAEIDVVSSKDDTEESRLAQSLQTAVNKLASRHVVENFAVVYNPTTEEQEKLMYLRDFFSICTGIEVENELFIFTGKGAKGININQQAIGLHRAMLVISFEEALATFIHEVAHNRTMNHDNQFIDTNEALNAKVLEYLSAMAERARHNQLTSADRALQKIRYNWYR